MLGGLKHAATPPFCSFHFILSRCSAGFLGFGFTIFTKKCQLNWIQVGKSFQLENFPTMGLGTVNSSTKQPTKWKQNQETTTCWGTFTARLPSFFFLWEIVVVCRQSSGYLIEVKMVKMRLRSLQNCCSSEVSAKHCWKDFVKTGGWMGSFSIHFFWISKGYP